MTTWAEHVTQGRLTVKGYKATPHQAEMMALIVTTTARRGGDEQSRAGAVATAIQESEATNRAGGDRDSQGLYQQRPSMGWGTVAQIRTPSYAVGKFLDQYLSFRQRGLGWLEASHRTQRSAFPSAPAKWYGEGQKAALYFAGSGSGGSVDVPAGSSTSSGDSSYEVTREKPYEFSRGSPDEKENTWDCTGRLADEVSWRRFTRYGQFWFVSDRWLNAQPVVAHLTEFSSGVLSLTYDYDTRQSPAEATLKVMVGRYGLSPGDVVALYDEGAASGRWLISGLRRSLHSNVADVTLTRPQPRLPEPPPETETITVGGSEQSMTSSSTPSSSAPSGSSVPAAVQACYLAAQRLSDRGIPYSQTHRTLVDNPPSADCSSSTSYALWKAGIPLPAGVRSGQWAPVSGAFTNWGLPGPGRYFTIYTNAGHIWIRWNGIGTAWRFDTSPYGSGGNGPRQRSTSRPTDGFVARHWQGL